MSTRHISPAEMEQARAELTKAAMLSVAGMYGPELVGVDVPDSDCIRYIVEKDAGIPLDIKKYL